MKKFADFFIKATNIEEFRECVKLAKILGYSAIGSLNSEERMKICEEEGIEFIKRSMEYGKKREEGLIYYAEFEDKKQAINQVKRYPINVLSVNFDKIEEINEELINFISQRNVLIEIYYKDLLKVNLSEFSRTLRRISRITDYCYRKGYPIIISSGAENKKELRAPREVISFIKTLGLKSYDLSISMSKDLIKIFSLYEKI